jgi:hypothetical protein
MRIKVGWRFEIALYDALRSIGVPADKTMAVINALELELIRAATRDVLNLEQPFELQRTGQIPTNDAEL